MKQRPAKQRRMAGWRAWGDHPWFVAISAAAALATVVSLVIALLGNPKTELPSVPQDHDISKPAYPPVEPVLPEQQARAQIGTLLRNGELDRAIEFVEDLPLGTVRAEECDRVFSFCIKNPQLDEAHDKAKRIATLCWDGDRRQKAMEEIALALLRER